MGDEVETDGDDPWIASPRVARFQEAIAGDSAIQNLLSEANAVMAKMDFVESLQCKCGAIFGAYPGPNGAIPTRCYSCVANFYGSSKRFPLSDAFRELGAMSREEFEAITLPISAATDTGALSGLSPDFAVMPDGSACPMTADESAFVRRIELRPAPTVQKIVDEAYARINAMTSSQEEIGKATDDARLLGTGFLMVTADGAKRVEPRNMVKIRLPDSWRPITRNECPPSHEWRHRGVSEPFHADRTPAAAGTRGQAAATVQRPTHTPPGHRAQDRPVTHLILVLGMHRSGTSLVAKSLECLGVALGDRAEWYGPDNRSGFWEDQDALAINAHALRLLGREWNDPTPIPHIESWLDDPQNRAAHIFARFIRERLHVHPVFGLKEPRLCRLLPLWRRAALLAGCKVSVVHVIRHPAAVAASLHRRNSIAMDQGLALWLEYTRRQFLDADPSWPSVVVGYDHMMALPQQQVARIGAALGLGVDVEKTRAFARNFVDATLWHEVAEDGVRLPIEVAAAWALAQERAKL